MTKEYIQRIHRVFGILLSISILVSGVCLMVQCVGIYRSGDQPYSRETVAAAFQPIAIPIYLTLAMIVAGSILNFFLPDPDKKPGIRKQYTVILKRLHAKTDLALCGDELRAAVEAEQKSRKRNQTVFAVLMTLFSVLFLCYGLNPGNYHQSQINGSMIKAVSVLFCCMAVPFCYGIYLAKHREASIRREIDLLKQAPAAAKVTAKTESAAESAKAGKILRAVVLCVAVAIMVFGFCTGGTADVLTKAINICTECVGLG